MSSSDVWYYNQNLKPQGPITLAEMRHRIMKGDVGPSDLISHGDSGDWKPASEWREFEVSLFPAVQSFVPGAEVSQSEKEWVLLVPSEDGGGLQQGPYSIREIQDGLRTKKISRGFYIWKAGLSGWCRIEDRPEFALESSLKRP